jgi:hypothetical protein
MKLPSNLPMGCHPYLGTPVQGTKDTELTVSPSIRSGAGVGRSKLPQQLATETPADDHACKFRLAMRSRNLQQRRSLLLAGPGGSSSHQFFITIG